MTRAKRTLAEEAHLAAERACERFEIERDKALAEVQALRAMKDRVVTSAALRRADALNAAGIRFRDARRAFVASDGDKGDLDAAEIALVEAIDDYEAGK